MTLRFYENGADHALCSSSIHLQAAYSAAHNSPLLCRDRSSFKPPARRHTTPLFRALPRLSHQATYTAAHVVGVVKDVVKTFKPPIRRSTLKMAKNIFLGI